MSRITANFFRKILNKQNKVTDIDASHHSQFSQIPSNRINQLLAANRSKYNNKKVEIDGYVLDSKKEARRYILLKHRQDAGEILDLKVHPKYPIIIDKEPVKIKSEGYPNGRTVYVELDFSYYKEGANEIIIEDVKGVDTDISRLKRAIFEAIYKIKVDVIR